MGRLWMFFFWAGRGGEEKAPGHVSRVGFRWTTRAIEQPHFFDVIYYILSSGNFADACFRPSRTVPPNPRVPGQTRALFGFRHPDDLFHTLKTVKVCCTSSHHGLHGPVGMVSCAHAVYVIYYFCYIFSLGPSSGRTGSVQIYRSSCERYTPNIYRCIPT